MKTNYLFPHKFKWISGVLFILAALLLIFWSFSEESFKSFQINSAVFAIADTKLIGENIYFSISENNILDELVMFILIASGLIFAFSKEKTEDEMTAKIRLDSLVWATYANYLTFLFCVLFVYGMIFLNVIIYAFFTHLLFFVVRLNWMMYKFNRVPNEE